MQRDAQMEFNETIKDKLASHENALASAATRSSNAIFRYNETERSKGPRLNFWRDGDRITHSFSFNRYIDKTQVFSNIEDDRISHRIIHVQFLAKTARFIGRVLDLNEDLIESIAYGHDVGHCPFGHEGEKVLDSACERYGIGHFHHNAQSIVFLDQLESTYKQQPGGFPGLNLSLQTLDGILAHNGEIQVREIRPALIEGIEPGELISCFDKALERIIASHETLNLQPITIEGCIVRFVDTISYIGRDIEDTITLGLITREDIPETMLGNSNKTIIDVLVKDLIQNTQESGLSTVAYSEDVHDALKKVYEFNMNHIYKHPWLRQKIEAIPAQMDTLFEQACVDLDHQNEDSPVYLNHVNLIGRDYLHEHEATPAIIARDFVAGMTDHFFKKLASQLDTS